MHFTKENFQSKMSSPDDGNISDKWSNKLPETSLEAAQFASIRSKHKKQPPELFNKKRCS